MESANRQINVGCDNNLLETFVTLSWTGMILQWKDKGVPRPLHNLRKKAVCYILAYGTLTHKLSEDSK